LPDKQTYSTLILIQININLYHYFVNKMQAIKKKPAKSTAKESTA